jgi:hypothetical protein
LAELRIQVLAAASTKMVVFWTLAPCRQNFTDVSEMHASFVIRAIVLLTERRVIWQKFINVSEVLFASIITAIARSTRHGQQLRRQPSSN